MMQPERAVRKKVIAYLYKQGHSVFPHDTKARMSSRGVYATFNPDYATRGEADLLVFAQSSPISPIWMELKKPGKHTIDPAQVLFRDHVRSLGHEYVVVNGVDDCKALGL